MDKIPTVAEGEHKTKTSTESHVAASKPETPASDWRSINEKLLTVDERKFKASLSINKTISEINDIDHQHVEI